MASKLSLNGQKAPAPNENTTHNKQLQCETAMCKNYTYNKEIQIKIDLIINVCLEQCKYQGLRRHQKGFVLQRDHKRLLPPPTYNKP